MTAHGQARILKTAALFAPLLFLILLLKVTAQPAKQFAQRVSTHFIFNFESNQYYGDWAELRLRPFLRAMNEKHGFPELRVKPKINVYLLRRESDLHRFEEIADHPDPMKNGGYFYADRGEIAVIMDHTEDRDRRVLYHEMTHVLLAQEGPNARWSPWLEEGLAITFEMFDGKSDSPVDPAHARAVMKDLIPLQEFLSADPEKFSPGHRRLYYLESHLLVAFLLKEHREAFEKYRAEEREDGAIDFGRFAHHFGDVEEEWKQFIARFARP